MPISILSRAMMIFGRIEMTTSDREERCCGCLHVRFATIMLGCYLVISNTAFILFAPPLQPTAMSNGTFYYIPTSSDLNSQAVKEAMAKNSEYMGKDESNKRHKIVFSGDNDLEEFEAAGKRPKPENREAFRSVEPLKHFVQCAIAMMMVYGAYSFKSMYLMPFICVRFFQLLRLILGIAGWLTHATRAATPVDPPMDTPSATANDEQETEQSMNEAPPSDFISSSYGFSIGVIICLVYISVLIYTLNIGFKCYKYILRHNRTIARQAAVNNGQHGGDGSGVISFWGPDGSVNPIHPHVDPSAGEAQAEEYLVEGMPAFKLPKYSEVAQDPEGKKYLIVTMPPSENASSQTGPSAVQELGPPPSFSEVTGSTDVPIDEPPPCYDEVSIGITAAEQSDPTEEQRDPSNVRPDGQGLESNEESSRV